MSVIQLYIDTGSDYETPFGHPFAGYYLAYPETNFSGLVSEITDVAPIMNWIYIDRQTYEVKFGTRQFSEGQYTGPFDCTRQERRLTFGGWEGFVAVLEPTGVWSLYFDRDSDRLREKVAAGTTVIEVELYRREIRGKQFQGGDTGSPATEPRQENAEKQQPTRNPEPETTVKQATETQDVDTQESVRQELARQEAAKAEADRQESEKKAERQRREKERSDRREADKRRRAENQKQDKAFSEKQQGAPPKRAEKPRQDREPSESKRRSRKPPQRKPSVGLPARPKPMPEKQEPAPRLPSPRPKSVASSVYTEDILDSYTNR